jgi:hypothetical protein
MGVGIAKNRKGLYIDSRGRTLPGDNLMIKKVSKEEKELNKQKGVLRVENPAVAKDIRRKSFTFGSMTALAATRFTNKRFKLKSE